MLTNKIHTVVKMPVATLCITFSLIGCNGGSNSHSEASSQSQTIDNQQTDTSTTLTSSTQPISDNLTTANLAMADSRQFVAFEAVNITQSPSSQMSTQGDAVTLKIAATGTPPLTYTWYKDGEQILQGIDLDTFHFDPISEASAGQYYAVVSNDYSSDTTTLAHLTVFTPAMASTARLSWRRPEQRADGSPLSASDISGYKVYYSASENEQRFEEHHFLEGGDTTAIDIDNLSETWHYFRISTIDTHGLESLPSSIVALEIKE